jgi:non-canonical purine NTP pyrophosphatase (RdgB/HAM1 family)
MAAPVVFITGNQKKADYLANYLGYPVGHIKIDLDEIQSLDLQEVVRHKVREAYAKVGKPVLVEDVSLEFQAFGKLPGTFIKWFLEEIGPEDICRLLDGRPRYAQARCIFGYFDGKNENYFEGGMSGVIAQRASGSKGMGWDVIFIPAGYAVPRAELNEEDDRKTYLQIKPLAQVKEFLQAR